jgi:hypothetical protein
MRFTSFIGLALGAALGSSLFATAPGSAAALVQIESARTNMAAANMPYRVIACTEAPDLSTAEEVAAFRNALVADGAAVPAFDGTRWSLGTLGGCKGVADPVGNVKTMVFPLIRTGQGVYDLTWDVDGVVCHTQCAYDGNGIVYDHVMSNLAILKAAPDAIARETSASSINYSRSWTWTIDWIWGSQRGQINVIHYVNAINKKVQCQWGSATAYMDLGSAQALYHDINETSYYGKAQYGFAWATPTMSIDVTWNAGEAQFHIGISGVGSSGSGQGTDCLIPW